MLPLPPQKNFVLGYGSKGVYRGARAAPPPEMAKREEFGEGVGQKKCIFLAYGLRILKNFRLQH